MLSFQGTCRKSHETIITDEIPLWYEPLSLQGLYVLGCLKHFHSISQIDIETTGNQLHSINVPSWRIFYHSNFHFSHFGRDKYKLWNIHPPIHNIKICISVFVYALCPLQSEQSISASRDTCMSRKVSSCNCFPTSAVSCRLSLMFWALFLLQKVLDS